MSKVLIIL